MLGTTSGGWTRTLDVLSSKNQILDIYGVVAVEPYWPEATREQSKPCGAIPAGRWKEIPTKNPVGLLQNIRALPILRFVLEGKECFRRAGADCTSHFRNAGRQCLFCPRNCIALKRCTIILVAELRFSPKSSQWLLRAMIFMSVLQSRARLRLSSSLGQPLQ